MTAHERFQPPFRPTRPSRPPRIAARLCVATLVALGSTGAPRALTAPASRTQKIRAWEPIELTFTARQAPVWDSFPLRVTVSDGRRKLEVDGYWDGARTWRVRLALPGPGRWRWRTQSCDRGLHGRAGVIEAVAPSAADVQANPNLRGHLRISDDKRYFQHADGTPFFFLADTQWAFNSVGSGVSEKDGGNGNFERVLSDRRAKGFSALLLRYLGENEGGRSIVDGAVDPDSFAKLDVRMRRIWEEGFVAAGHPEWWTEYGYTPEAATKISRYLYARYGAYNLIWSLSGEYRFKGAAWKTPEPWRALGAAMARLNDAAYRHPLSVHPFMHAPYQNPAHHFGGEPWLDHLWIQTGQDEKHGELVAHLNKAWASTPTRPVMLAEAAYEGDSLNPAWGVATAQEILWEAWVTYLNGGLGGYGYGARGLWQFCLTPPACGPSKHDDAPLDWRRAADLPGSKALKNVASFLRAVAWWTLEPRSEGLTVDGGPRSAPTNEDTTPPHMAASADGRLHVVYIPAHNERTIAIGALPPGRHRIRWYQPVKGKYHIIRDAWPLVLDRPTAYVLPPRPHPERDWVLLVEADAPPGTGRGVATGVPGPQ